jgi:hypothetical protein
MERIDRWREILQEILQRYADIPNRYIDVSTYLLVSGDLNHFMLMQEGWHQKQRFYGAIVHAEIREDKIWIHYDGIEDGITDELVASGIPKANIVLAFHPPYVRPDTGYAIA